MTSPLRSTVPLLVALLAPMAFAQTAPARPGAETRTDDVVKLDTLVVNETADSYNPKKATSGTKTEVLLLETPVSVQAISREIMDDQQVINVKEATKNVSGVLPSAYQFYEAYIIRGFDTGTNVYRNGLRQPSFSDQQTSNVEQVEVLKGPGSILYGRIEPGGLVNIVTKRPLAQPAYSLQQQVGSYDLYRTTMDATGPLAPGGAVLYRLNLSYQENGSFVNFLENRGLFIAPSLTWHPNSRFELNVDTEFQRRKYVHFGTNGGGVPAIGNRPANLPRSLYIGDPILSVKNQNRQDRDYLGFDWTLRLGDKWKLKHRLGYTAVDYLTRYAGARSFNETTGEMAQTLQGAFQDRKSYATNLDLTGEFSTGAARHQVLLGVDYFRLKQNYYGLGLGTVVVPLPSINVFNPVYVDNSAIVAATPDNSFFVRKEYWTGVYFQDHVRFGDQWHLLLGGRFDDASHGTGSNSVIGGNLATAWRNLVLRNDEAFSPRVGLLYQATPWLSAYGSYVRSFGTNNGVSASGEPFDPQGGIQYEAGLKSELLGGKLTTTLAIFEITKTNMLTRDPANPLFSIPIGEARSRGVEWDVAGRINKHWSVIGNLTYDDAEVTLDNRGNQGKILPGVSRRSGSLWVRYDATGNPVKGLTFGAGVYARSQRQGDTANTYQLPGYARVDAMVAYKFQAFGARVVTAQLNVQNLLDKVYFDHGGSGGTRFNIYYGEPLSFTAALRLQY